MTPLIIVQEPSSAGTLRPDTLVIGSGGSMLYAYLGALSHLAQAKRLSNIHRYIGVSAGAILSLLLVLSHNDVDAFSDIIFRLNFKDLQSFSILRLVTFFGLDHGDKMIDELSKFMVSKGYSTDITFRKLFHLTKKELCVGVVNVNDMKFHMLDSSSDVSVLQGVRASFSVPFIYTPVRINGCLYVDGAVMDPYPYLSSKQIWPESEFLGLRIRYHASRTHRTSDIPSLLDYIKSLLACITISFQSYEDRSKDDGDIPIDVEYSSWQEFLQSPSDARKKELFDMGRNAVKK